MFRTNMRLLQTNIRASLLRSVESWVGIQITMGYVSIADRRTLVSIWSHNRNWSQKNLLRRSQTIADDRRSVFPYDRRRSQNFLRSAIRDPRSSAIIWKPAFNQLTAPRKFDFLQTNILILRTSNFQGATIRPIVPRQTLYCLYRSPLNFPPRVIQKSYWIIFNSFRWKPLKSNVKFEKETDKNPLSTILIFYFL